MPALLAQRRQPLAPLAAGPYVTPFVTPGALGFLRDLRGPGLPTRDFTGVAKEDIPSALLAGLPARINAVLGFAGGITSVGNLFKNLLPMNSTLLRPAIKQGNKVFKGKPGQTHMDVFETVEKKRPNSLSRERIPGEFNKNLLDPVGESDFGFVGPEGTFLSREEATKFLTSLKVPIDYVYGKGYSNPPHSLLAQELTGNSPTRGFSRDTIEGALQSVKPPFLSQMPF